MKHSLLLYLFLSTSVAHAMKHKKTSSIPQPPKSNEWTAQKTLTPEQWKEAIKHAKPIPESRESINKDGTIERIDENTTCKCIIF